MTKQITVKINLAKSVLAEIVTEANRTARLSGFNRATKIIPGEKHAVIECTEFGYRKNTTGEYVPHAYLSNFGWKNTYYQNAECVVSIPQTLCKKVDKWINFLTACPEYDLDIPKNFNDALTHNL